ncbi:MAG: DEAD/DEAH box helicase [Candidatus Helarchaeota archaeon]
MPLDPLKMYENIENGYLSYLRTVFHLHDNDFRKAFNRALENFNFINGPFLETAVPFKKGKYLEELVKEGILEPELGNIILESLTYLKNNPLYLHQEIAIRKILEGRNVVITSGTNSGKTECFLIPIFNTLIKEYKKGKLEPGVRALFLYPMNALANDQLRRIRKIVRYLEKKYPDIKITFGRYIGETKEKKIEAENYFLKIHSSEERIKSELLSREEMRESPPHILITNYAMLEYLLLRPKDCPFFDEPYNKHWKFIVLDEVHVYKGASGIEMGMLIRRLKDRICKSQKGKIQCIATSATLVKEPKNFEKIAEFASNLFNENFEWNPEDESCQDIIRGEKIEIKLKDNLTDINFKFLNELDQIINSYDKDDYKLKQNIINLFKKYEISINLSDLKNLSSKELVYKLLENSKEINKLKYLLSDGVLRYDECLQKLNHNEPEYLYKLIKISNWSVYNENLSPALPLKYHLFVRAPEGVYISFYPEIRIYLDRRQKLDDGTPIFELGACRSCGKEYLIGIIKGGRLVHSIKNPDGFIENEFCFFINIPNKILLEDEDGIIKSIKKEKNNPNIYKLCSKCGKIWEIHSSNMCDCNVNEKYYIYLEKIDLKEGNLTKCKFCGKSGHPNILSRFIFMREAPSAVLASNLFQNLVSEYPKDKNKSKMIIFSDSRQDAAYFAPYFSNNYKKIMYRSMIYKVLLDNQRFLSDFRIESLGNDLLKLTETNNIFPSTYDNKNKLNEVYFFIMNEFCPFYYKNSLEGVGLISFQPIIEESWKPIPELLEAPWNLSENEAKDIYKFMLNSLRFKRIISFPDDGPSPTDERFAPLNKSYYVKNVAISKVKLAKQIIGFIPRFNNTRLDYLKKIYSKINNSEDENNECKRILDLIWQDIINNSDIFHILSKNDKNAGVLYYLDHRFWKIKLEDINNPWFYCIHCGHITPYNVKNVCPVYNCNGKLVKIKGDIRKIIEDNYYRKLYTNFRFSYLNVNEHTAQLTSQFAQEIQEKFLNGEVNVLSCSTTYELGVDLGELEIIFLKNVPPEPFNYIQRSGRAGRRHSSTGFTLTFALLRSHDLYYFTNPKKLIDGKVAPPYIEINNEKIARRHLHSVVFADFFKNNSEYFGKLNSFFRLNNKNDFLGGYKLFEKYIKRKPDKIKNALKRIIPRNLHETFDLDNWGWIEHLISDEKGKLTLAKDELIEEYTDLKKYINKLSAEIANSAKNIYKITNEIRWASNREKTILNKYLIDFLASHNIIPKYGFPVDVVELKIRQHTDIANKIQLERDLKIAISEFAPKSQVVANNYIWESAGIKRLQNREWEFLYYSICDECQNFQMVNGKPDESPKDIICNNCGLMIPSHKQYRMIIPEFGFTTAQYQKLKRVTEIRPKKEYSTRPYFFGMGDNSRIISNRFKINSLEIECRYSTSERFAVICKGKKNMGFSICFECGWAKPTNLSRKSRTKNREHKTPADKKCNGKIYERIHLGHYFKTDILLLIFKINNNIIISANNNSFWLSLLYAIINGASIALGIHDREIDGCLYSLQKNKAIVLFDTVPGGAGNVKQLLDKDNFKKVLYAAKSRLENCTCSIDTSCYGCLRSYRNQYCHDELKRGLVLDFLNKYLL